MAKGSTMNTARKATQQRIDDAFRQSSAGGENGGVSKAELRASIPAYDESMVKRVAPATKSKSKKK